MKNPTSVILLLFLSQTTYKTSFSQSHNNTQQEINQKIQYANQLIWHLNKNLSALNTYQKDLVIWFENSQRQENDIPVYKFDDFSSESLFISQKDRLDKDLFNYNYHLDKIESSLIGFNNLCRQLELNTYQKNRESLYVQKIVDHINSIEHTARNLAETAYDFSRSCAVKFKAKNENEDLLLITNLVSQSKNTILALRENNKSLVVEFFGQLDFALQEMNKKNELNLWYNQNEISLSEEKFSRLTNEIYTKAFNISSWAESYIQSHFTNKELVAIIQEAIQAFNDLEGRSGCASAFNEILQHSSNSLMLYVEEPNTILVEQYLVDLKHKKQTEQAKEEKFDIANLHSLSGSLPNNLILLLDVSVSMKSSGKLPILEKTIAHFLDIMRPQDKLSIISFSGQTQILISGASAYNKTMILDTLSKVKSSGGTDIYQALIEAKKIGDQHFINQGNNKIIVASDGIFGINKSVLSYTESLSQQNYTLSIFQFSKANEKNNHSWLQALAEKGRGSYTAIYNIDEAIITMMKEIKKEAKLKN